MLSTVDYRRRRRHRPIVVVAVREFWAAVELSAQFYSVESAYQKSFIFFILPLLFLIFLSPLLPLESPYLSIANSLLLQSRLTIA